MKGYRVQLHRKASFFWQHFLQRVCRDSKLRFLLNSGDLRHVIMTETDSCRCVHIYVCCVCIYAYPYIYIFIQIFVYTSTYRGVRIIVKKSVPTVSRLLLSIPCASLGSMSCVALHNWSCPTGFPSDIGFYD